MKKIQVGMFMDSWYPDLNGVILVMENLIKNMRDYADITLVIPKTGSEADDKNYPFKIIRVDSIPLLNTGYYLGLVDLKYFKYKKMFENIDFDIIHIQSPAALGRLGIRVAREKNIPVVATMHVRWEFEFKKYLKSTLLSNLCIKHLIKSYNKCNSCIALNRALIDVYKGYGYKGEFTIIHNGTDLEIVKDPKKATAQVNNMFRFDEDEKVFLFVGRIISIKNIFFILNVLRKLKEMNYAFKMLYVGTGPDYDALLNKVKEYNMEDEVILTGKILDRDLLKAIYYRADLFIFPSLFDSSSLVQIEAASQETPTIFVDGSVTSDTVEDNINGFKEKEDVVLFAKRIINIMEDKKLYNKVKKSARKDLATSWSDIGKETYDYYIKTINEYNN